MKTYQSNSNPVKAFSGSLKVAFDSTMINFLEANEVIQLFQNGLEDLEETHQNGEYIAKLKQLSERLKEIVLFLRMKFDKKSGKAEEGIKILQGYLKKVDNILGLLYTENLKFEQGFGCKKRLKTGLHSHAVALKREQLTDKKRKLVTLEKTISTTEFTIRNLKMEKEALVESCYKMEARAQFNEQGDSLSNWCAKIFSKFPRVFILRSPTVDCNTLAIEFMNPPNSPLHSPRLILTVTFMKRVRYGIPYSMMHAKVNQESLDVETFTDFAIQKNNLSYLLNRLLLAWGKHFSLLLEVISLRERFPVDWQPHEGKLCVLLGDRVNINCMLNIPRGYPLQDRISIEKIEGGNMDVDVAGIQPHESDVSLTAWVEHLAAWFHRM